MQWTKETAEQKLAEMGMDDLPLMPVCPVATAVASDWFVQYRNLCHKFMESLSDSVDQLAMMGLTQDEFMGVIMGRKVPENFSIRLRVPLQWGGKLEIDNLFMCSTFPVSNKLDRFIIAQSGAKTLWMPNPAKKIYSPTHTGGGGDGGNATEDRLSQLAAQLAAERGKE